MIREIKQQNAERRLRHCRWDKPDPHFRIKLGLLVLGGCLAFIAFVTF